MYPGEILTSVNVDRVSSGLCGAFRPGHFQGVATVVAKLFHIVPAHRAYFGEKDAQQLAVIQTMAADLNFPIEIVPVETVREPDGLALSSRNVRLSPEDRKLAPALYRALRVARESVERGDSDPRSVRRAALDVLEVIPQFRVEYLEVVDARTMQPATVASGPLCIAVAAWLGGVRLIDNIRLSWRAL
jgi:pantoate--beta-alanine ligase